MAKTKIDRIAIELAQLRKEKRDEIMTQTKIRVPMVACDRALVSEVRKMRETRSKKGLLLEWGLPKRKRKR